MPNDISARLLERAAECATASASDDKDRFMNVVAKLTRSDGALMQEAATPLDQLSARIQELEGALREAENRIVALYDGIAPQAHYEDLGIEGDRSGNRHADNDEVVQRIRAALNGGDGNG